jgi:hypothetical protein
MPQHVRPISTDSHHLNDPVPPARTHHRRLEGPRLRFSDLGEDQSEAVPLRWD